MKKFITGLLAGKKVAIMGFGREGRSSYRLLRNYMPEQKLYILDSNPTISEDAELTSDSHVELQVGPSMTDQLGTFDIILKAPGVPARLFPENFDTGRITSQTDLFLRHYGNQVIGVTGTKGKSTTSSLIHHILASSGFHTMLVGNIGLPPFEAIGDITPDSRIVMELSSHQLQFISRSPHIAILLNIFQEHLDHYGSYEEYQQAKLNIGRYQQKNDYFLYSEDNSLLQSLLAGEKSGGHRLLPYSLTDKPENGVFRRERKVFLHTDSGIREIMDATAGIPIPGEHNFSNAMVAAAACYLAGASEEQINRGVQSFKGLEHRIEFVGEVDGIRFYNDSIATIPEAAMEAVKTLKEVDTLILGGYDRGIDYSALYPFLCEQGIGNLIFIGAAGNRMMEEMMKMNLTLPLIHKAADYEEVVRLAKKFTQKGRICLLSPAASSYDMFKNFEHRGNIYKKNVRGLGLSQK